MKKFAKILAILMALALVFSFAACGGKDDGNKDSSTSAPAADVTKSASELTVGFIFLHDENSTYDLNFINAAEAACKATGAKIIKKTNVPENSACYEAAADLVDSGCDIVFADSFGHEDFIIQAAKEFPNVQFCHATGTKAHTENLANYHNAFASIYQGRYLAGIAAGMKLNEMIAAGQFKAEKAKIGYVGAFLCRGYLRLYFILSRRKVSLPHRYHGSYLHRQLV